MALPMSPPLPSYGSLARRYDSCRERMAVRVQMGWFSLSGILRREERRAAVEERAVRRTLFSRADFRTEGKSKKFVLDGEIAIPVQGSFSFEVCCREFTPPKAGSRTCLRVSCEFGRLGLADFCRLETVLEEIKEQWHGRPSRSFL
jgi:hypothetical protein